MLKNKEKNKKKIVVHDIGELLTLSGAKKKAGRNITEKDLSPIPKAAFVIDHGKIEWMGKESHLPKSYIDASSVSLGGATVLPAFIEAHTHLLFGGDRSDEFERRNQGATYQEIAAQGGGILSTVRKTRKTSLEDLIVLGQKRVHEFLKQGVTTIEVKSGYGLSRGQEIKMLKAAQSLKKGRIVTTFLGAHAVGPEKKSSDDHLEEMMEVIPYIAKHKLALRVDIFIEKGYFNASQAKAYFQQAQKYGLERVAHCDQLSSQGGSVLAMQYQARSIDHLVYITHKEIEQLARSETVAVLLPGADFYLKLPFPPARLMIQKGVRVALASDFNPGSCPTQDISFIGVLARLEMKMSLPEVITAYTLNAAYALGLEKVLGTLEIGKAADFVVLEDSWSQLFYKVGKMPVREVWTHGERAY